MRHRLFVVLFAIVASLEACATFAFATSAFAQEAFAQDESHPLWMRYPAISPDGSTIAFEYQGDIYTVPSAGGHATAIVTHDAYDFHPVWSPDGKWIAYASDRFGNFDVFLVPSAGGVSKRLTVHSTKEIPTCFTPDGKSVIFYAARMDDVKNVEFPTDVMSELYSVSVDGGLPKQILTTPAQDAQMDRSGTRILYHDRKGFENEWRKHHVSSIARDVWLYDMKTKKHTKLTTFEGEDRNPVWSPDESEVYYLCEKSGTFNVWKMPLKHPEQTVQLTSFEKHPVRFLSASQVGSLAFGFDGEIYVMATPTSKPQKVAIEITPTEKANTDHFSALTSGASEFAVSPNGKEFAVIVRGDIFVTSMDYEITKRITSTPEQERNVSFSPDGRSLIYASERGGSWKIYETTIAHKDELYFYAATTLDEQPVVANEKENFQPHYSPNGDEVAYLEERTTLKVINLKTKETRTIMDGKENYSYTDGDQWYQWCPDGKWFLVTFLDHNRWSSEVGLVDALGKKPIVNLTNSGYDDSQPHWSADGKMMYWFSDREGLRSHGNRYSETDVYGMFFTQAAYDKFKQTRAEFDLAKDVEKEKQKEREAKDTTTKKEEKKKPDADKKKAIWPITVDLKNLDDRTERLTINSGRMSDAVLSKDGERLYYVTSFPTGSALWVHKFRDNETKILTRLWSGGADLALDDEGKELYLFKNGVVSKIDTSSGNERLIGYRAEMELNTPEERLYMFEHVWRQMLKKFYVEDMQGVDWQFYKDAYARFLPYITNNYDFAEMLSEMLGELNASHTGSGYRPPNPEHTATASLGAFFDPDYTGKGIKIQEIIERGPLDRSASKIRNGTVVLKIDGNEITPAVDYALYLDRKAEKQTLLTLYDPKGDTSWEEIVKPVSRDEENELLYQRWVKSRRLEVDSLSHGKIGYVHVRSMGDDSYRHVYSEVLGREYDKDALIVDTRFNGGGWLHDELATLLSGKEYVKFYPRHQDLGSEPQGKWAKPSVLLVSESNYSDAHFFPYTYQALGIGKIVGMPVAGTATAVWWETLQDNSLYFGIPQVGMLDMHGKYLENQQLVPDYIVNNDPESVAQGRDLQLEKAVEVLMGGKN